MNKILPIALKELKTYFRSPIAYIVLIVAMTVFNVFFFMIIDGNKEATLRDIFKVMEFMFVFIIPLLTMKTFAEEKSVGTMEFLMTTPTSNLAIVLGKYIGSLIFFTLIASVTIVYYGIIEYFGNPDRVALWTGCVGLWLEGAMFIAIGLLASSWTKNQIIAAMVTYMVSFYLYFSLGFIKYVNGPLEEVIRYVSVLTHSENFYAGLVMASDLVYYFSIILFCLLLTRVSIENRL